MTSFRTEISIPVNKDNRTLEQRHQEVFNVLEEKYSQPTVTENSRLVNRDRSSLLTKMNHDSFFDKDRFFKSNFDNWDNDVSDWIQNSRKRWDEEMTNIKQSMFTLDSDRDNLDFHSWDPFSSTRKFGDFNKRESETQRQHKISNCQERSQLMRESKSPLFPSSSLNSSFDQNPTVAVKEDMFRNFYEFGSDGQLHFKIRFEAANIKPEDIKVTCTGNTLNIVVQKSDLNKIDLHKSIVVPSSVDSQKFQCHVTQDGILVLEAPVKSPDYTSVVPQEKLFSETCKSQTTDRNQGLVIRNTSGPVILNDEKGKRLHLEIPVDCEYVPGDFSVTTESNKISVKGRHEIKTINSSSFKEFSQYYEIPESIDPMSVNLHVVDGMLVIEALVQ